MSGDAYCDDEFPGFRRSPAAAIAVDRVALLPRASRAVRPERAGHAHAVSSALTRSARQPTLGRSKIGHRLGPSWYGSMIPFSSARTQTVRSSILQKRPPGTAPVRRARAMGAAAGDGSLGRVARLRLGMLARDHATGCARRQQRRGGTPHHSSSWKLRGSCRLRGRRSRGFVSPARRVEAGAALEHRDKQSKQPVGDAAQGAAVALATSTHQLDRPLYRGPVTFQVMRTCHTSASL